MILEKKRKKLTRDERELNRSIIDLTKQFVQVSNTRQKKNLAGDLLNRILNSNSLDASKASKLIDRINKIKF